QRRKMCALAGREIATRLGKPSDFVCVSDVEAELAHDRDRPNYTAETLALLRLRSSPRSGLIFLISSELVSGPDPEFGRWYRPDRILELAHLAICPRPGYPLNARFVRALARVGRGVVVLHAVETPHVASTELRRWLRDGVSPLALWHQGLLPTAVAQYLERHRLYASDAET
ncbi:MAG: nicotinate-nicotinamide nucleotide adenylyltransferase, partial [Anaerolineae bacterium]